MGNRQLSRPDGLFGEYLRHHLAHSKGAASGRGHRGCQFCPTLKVRSGHPRRGYARPGLFRQRFLRDLTRDVNKIKRMALGGHRGAKRFMKYLERLLKAKPWDNPPSSPGASLPTLLAEGFLEIRGGAQAV